MFQFGDSRDWFFQKRLGMFVHWGLYAINGFHEQEMFRRGLSRSMYRPLMNQFNPTKFDPDAWIDLAQSAGMEYLVVTAKHQDGFCLWDTKFTDFNIMNTPYKKDLIRQLADACQRRDFPLFLYYCYTDNMHPSFPNRGDWHQLAHPQEGDIPDTVTYIDYVRNQVRELCTNYGKLAGIWWDCGQELKCTDPSINDMIRELQPHALINNRGLDEGDYGTPERNYHESAFQVRKFPQPTETCESIGMNSWGYRVEEDYFSSKHLIFAIDRTLSLGGNYLLNVGPMADGTIGAPFVDCLKKVGAWLKANKEAFVEAYSVSDAIDNPEVYATCRGNTVYFHFYGEPKGSMVEIKGLDVLPTRITLLNDGRALEVRRDQNTKFWSDPLGGVRIRNLPVEEYPHAVMIAKAEFTKLPKRFRESMNSQGGVKVQLEQARD